ncbi:mitochondrial potassium channel ATP-binding subunit-like [Mya arenaria]|uniref:mitochondrial potassium channel ATP-binding subunit-like n=1 Tax=Mya arenaria TaxID=6604 RepID=UPI0022E563DE|nr:mitochondrial potassium channel ATP-binding subunit-like [Mya arenaria]
MHSYPFLNVVRYSKVTRTFAIRTNNVHYIQGIRSLWLKQSATELKQSTTSGTSAISKYLSLRNKLLIRIRQSALRKSNISSQDSSKTVSLLTKLCTVSGLTLGYAALNAKTLECETKTKSSRLDGINNERQVNDDVPFDWKQFAQLLWQDVLSLTLAVLCAFAAALVNIKVPLLVGEVVNVVSKFARETDCNFIEEIKQPAIKLIGTYFIQGALTVSYISLLSNVGENMSASLKIRLFDSLLRQDIQFFDRHKTGELVDRLTSDVQDFKSSFKLCISQGLRALTQTIGCIGALWVISPKLTGVMCVVIPVIISIGSVMGGGLRKLSKAAQAQVSRSTAVADEALGNVRTVRAFAMEEKEHELFSDEVNKARVLNIRLGLGIGMFQGLANIALNGIVLGTMFVGGLFMSRQEITAGDLMSFLVATQTVERSLAQMSVLFGQLVRGLSAGARVFEYINHDFSIPLKGGVKVPYHSLEGEIKFSDVHFTYPTRQDQEVLKGFSLRIPPGKTVALVGASGGGKSTIATLLQRFYDTDGGSITVDGIDIRDLDPSWLRGHAIGFINQEPVLFATSVMENIRYGKPDATDTEVMEAAQLANAHTFIEGFPEGYKTVLGERGQTVSGGQKQRIAIARALIKNPSILVLDEATSALDAESERVVQEALDTVSRGRTVLVIAHRLSTIRDADIIAVVSKGKIVEMGDHTSLKRKKGLYWELIRQQELEEEIQHFPA